MSEPRNSIRILLVGATGSGKSSTGNTILSADSDTVHSYFRVCTGSEPRTRDNEVFTRKVLGKDITIVDTPGADNIKDDPIKIQKEIREAILASGEGYDAIVLVIRLFKNSVMMTEEELKVIDIVQTILGKEFWDHGIFVFTYGNNYDRLLQQMREDGAINYPQISFDEFVQKNKLARNKFAIGKYAEKVNFATVKFENSEENVDARREMVQIFIEKVDEIIERNKGAGYGKNTLPEEEFITPLFMVRMWQNFLHYLQVHYHTHVLPRLQGINGLGWFMIIILAILLGVVISRLVG